jgi:hypothetical protein
MLEAIIRKTVHQGINIFYMFFCNNMTDHRLPACSS